MVSHYKNAHFYDVLLTIIIRLANEAEVNCQLLQDEYSSVASVKSLIPT